LGIKSEEISSLIKKRIKDFDVPILSADVGIVTEVGDGIAQIYGLKNAQALELLEFKGGTRGVAFNLEEDSVGAIILGPFEEIKEGEIVRQIWARLTQCERLIRAKKVRLKYHAVPA